jgi:hypothetical protein
MRKIQLLSLAAVAAALVVPASAAARLRAPNLVGPANNAVVQELPTIMWKAVRRATLYEYQVSGDRKFTSIIGTGRTHNLAAALAKLQPDAGY